ncbi:MAG: zinc-binding dehydrogenase [Clostridia bacterium]|nr:zinc-binding dehydrogenase [Clostridia bacterium]
MKGWKLVKPLSVKETEVVESNEIESLCKVKITKSLITRSDVLRYNGEIDCKNVFLGSSGVGIVVEAQANLFGLEKNNRVYIEPNRECSECFNCKSGNYTDCSDLQIAGEDFDGFLCDFCNAPADKLFLLPDSVSDADALFLGHISTALEIIDLLKIQKGDYVAVIGADSFGIIFSQLLMYYQAVPIVMTLDDENYKIAKESGIYYVLNKDDNWQKEVSVITGGRLAENVVYISDCNISSSKAFSLASHNASVVFTGTTYNNTVPFMQAIKKQLNILCVNNGFGNTASSINLLANKALDLSYLKTDTTPSSHVPQKLKELNDDYSNTGKTNEVIVEWL